MQNAYIAKQTKGSVMNIITKADIKNEGNSSIFDFNYQEKLTPELDKLNGDFDNNTINKIPI